MSRKRNKDDNEMVRRFRFQKRKIIGDQYMMVTHKFNLYQDVFSGVGSYVVEVIKNEE